MESSSLTLLPCEEGTCAVSFAISEDYTAVTLDDRSVHVLSSVDGNHRYSITDPRGIVWGVALAADIVVTGSVDGSLSAHDISKQSIIATAPGPANPRNESIITLVIIPDSSDPLKAVSASLGGELRYWDVGQQRCSAVFEGGHNSDVFRACKLEDKLFSASYEGSLCCWHLDTGDLVWRNQFSKQAYAFVAGDIDTVAVGFRDGEIKILNPEKGEVLASFAAHEKVVNGLRLYKDTLVSTGTDGWVKVWSANDHKLLRQVKMFDKAIVSRSMHGPLIVAGGKNGGAEENACGLDACVRAWSVDRNGSEKAFDMGGSTVVVWNVGSIDGRVVASLQRRGKPAVEIWRLSVESTVSS